MKRILDCTRLFVVLVASVALVTVALAAISTDKGDYAPGEPVTITGDGYLSQEAIDIVVNAPYGTVTGTATGDSFGAFRWSFRLAADDSAIGSYSYTATGRSSGVSQSGTFTDDGNDSPTACLGGPTVDVPDSFSDPAGLTVTSSTGTNVTATASAGNIFTAVCIKSGANTFGTQQHSALITVNSPPNYGNNGCYTVSGLGTSTVTVTRNSVLDGNRELCRDISHIDFVEGPAQPQNPTIAKSTDCPNIGIYGTEAVSCSFTISFTNPAGTAAVIFDTVRAEFTVTSTLASAGTVTTSQTNPNSATTIRWDVTTTSATLQVNISTVPSPGQKKTVLYKPTSCGNLPINDGATAFNAPFDPLNPIVLVGPSNTLVVQAVAGSKPCEVPQTVRNVTATVTAGGVSVDWADNGDAALTGYNVYKNNLLLVSLGTSPSQYLDIGGVKNDCYTVRAVNPVGESTTHKIWGNQTACAP